MLLNPNEGRSCLVTVENEKLVLIDKEVFDVPKLDAKVPETSKVIS
jgi:hypothetical protein